MAGDGSKKKHDGAKSTVTEEERVQIFARQMLANRVFVGNYVERRYVEPLNSYRDVIVVDQNEIDLKCDLDVVRKRVDGFYKGSIWIGITGPNMVGTPSGHCIWTNLEGIPFGECWFIIRKVSFTKYGEVVVKVNKVRDFKPIDARQPLSPGHSERPENYEQHKDVSLQNFGKTVTDVFPSLLSVLTFNNLKETVVFLSVLFMATLTGLLKSLQFLGEFSIRLFREVNNFIYVTTPFLLGFLDLIAKVVGGFYILIAMMWRGKDGPPPRFPALNQPPQKPHYPAIQHYGNFQNYRNRVNNSKR